MAQVIETAQWLGYMAFHVYDSRRCRAGFPDLVLLRANRIIYAELKTERGRLSPDQRVWLDALTEAGCYCYLWRPSDVDEVIRILESDRPTESYTCWRD